MASKNREKDQAMAARLKEAKEERTVGRCPICNAVVSLDHLQTHISYHP
jgi:hypothetical protein